MSSADEKEIEQEAKTHRLDDNTPFLHVVDDIGQALRNKYPLPNTAAVPKMKWDSEQNPREYLDKCKDMWTQQTGCHPGKPGVQQEWYRQAILEGIPETVKNAMKDNPDMAGCDSHTWEKHLIHHLTRALDKVQEEKATIKDLQSQLLKLQLGEARQKVNEAKKKDVKNNKVMVAAATSDTPNTFPIPLWEREPTRREREGRDPPPSWLSSVMYQGGYGRGSSGGRGGFGRGGFGGGPCQQREEGCYICGDPNHWCKSCPLKQGWQSGGPQPPQGPPRGRGYQGPTGSGRGGPARQMAVARGRDPWDGWVNQD